MDFKIIAKMINCRSMYSSVKRKQIITLHSVIFSKLIFAIEFGAS